MDSGNRPKPTRPLIRSMEGRIGAGRTAPLERIPRLLGDAFPPRADRSMVPRRHPGAPPQLRGTPWLDRLRAAGVCLLVLCVTPPSQGTRAPRMVLERSVSSDRRVLVQSLGFSARKQGPSYVRGPARLAHGRRCARAAQRRAAAWMYHTRGPPHSRHEAWLGSFRPCLPHRRRRRDRSEDAAGPGAGGRRLDDRVSLPGWGSNLLVPGRTSPCGM